MHLDLARDVLFDPRRDAKHRAFADGVWEDAEIPVQDGFRRLGGGFGAEKSGEQGYGRASGLVVIAAGDHFDSIVFHAIDQTVLAVYPARPCPRKITAKGLWFARPVVRVAQAFLDQSIDLAQRGPVSLLPMQEMFPSQSFEDKLHSSARASSSSIVLTIPLPASSSAIACNSIALLAGEAIK